MHQDTYLHIEYLLYIWGKHWTYLHLLFFFLRTLASSLLTTLFFFHPAWTLTLKVILLEYRSNLGRKKDNETDKRDFILPLAFKIYFIGNASNKILKRMNKYLFRHSMNENAPLKRHSSFYIFINTFISPCQNDVKKRLKPSFLP